MILAPSGTAAELDALAGRVRRHRADARLGAMGRAQAQPGRRDGGRGFLDAARPPRDAGAPRADGPGEGRGGDGGLAARAARQGHGARREVFARADRRGSRCSCTWSRKASRTCLEAAPIEVALLVEPALERPSDNEATRRWCAQLLGMYRAWADNRHMQLSEIAGASQRDLPLLVISGFGAHRLLAQEVGLHVLELARRGQGPGRATARVRLAVAPLGDLPAASSAARSPRRWSRAAAARRRAALSRRALAAGAQHERQLAHGQARRRAARRLRPDRREPGLGSPRPQAVRSIASSSSIMPSITPSPFCQNSRLEASRPKGASSSEWCLEPPASSMAKYFATKPGCASW